MRSLVLPTTELHAEFVDCLDDWGPGLHEDGFGIGEEDDLRTPTGFADWVHMSTRLCHPHGTPCPPEQHASPRWIVEDDRVQGGIGLRHFFHDEIGQIGYGVRPSARRRGLATWALGEMLVEARLALDVDQVLVVCVADNLASVRTIEANGGVLEGIRDAGLVPLRRYWVPTPPR